MISPIGNGVRRPSRMWLVVSGICAVLTAAAAFSAIAVQRAASTPIGEGEVFVRDIEDAARIISSADAVEDGVRHARNSLEVEAVSVLDPAGVVLASTSLDLAGHEIANPLLMFGATTGRFFALATAIPEPITIDGITEWPAGSVLYQVVAPISDADGSVLLHYDISELLARRVRPAGIQSEALQLLGLAAIFAVLGTVVFVGHSRAARRYRDLAEESELLRVQSEQLAAANAELSAARNEAERALALAEEKVRIRSEFVLMINHELRTPLTSVVTGARLMNDQNLSADERSKLLDAMVTEGERLQQIIDQMLAVARVENRGLSYTLTETPLEEICRIIRSSHSVPATGDAGFHDLTLVRTDVRTLAIVVASLRDNALTHGASNVRVNCSRNPIEDPLLEVGSRPEQAIYITVSDDGPGIDHSFLPRVFEKFEKSGFSSGTGLGLYMTRLMVEAIEGSIAVTSSPDGTTFQIALPLAATMEMADAR